MFQKAADGLERKDERVSGKKGEKPSRDMLSLKRCAAIDA
jgi:hypothetical protein